MFLQARTCYVRALQPSYHINAIGDAVRCAHSRDDFFTQLWRTRPSVFLYTNRCTWWRAIARQVVFLCIGGSQYEGHRDGDVKLAVPTHSSPFREAIK